MVRVIGVLSGKGGVGKSTICANLAIAFAELGKKVIAVDLDFGASNLHAILGVAEFTYNLTIVGVGSGKTRTAAYRLMVGSETFWLLSLPFLFLILILLLAAIFTYLIYRKRQKRKRKRLKKTRRHIE